jgi:hypothetical protein
MHAIRTTVALTLACFLGARAGEPPAPPEADPVGIAVTSYFATVFGRLCEVADKKPTVDTLRDAMKPLAEQTEGFFGGTLIDTNYVIRQVYNSRDFLARGFDLKKVKQLDAFWSEMSRQPAPQLSEPAHGSIMQPRLIAMRYPVVTAGKLESIVSIMVRTEAFLKASGLDRCAGYRITCRGALAEEEGDLPTNRVRTVTVKLPSTEWVVQYVPGGEGEK